MQRDNPISPHHILLYENAFYLGYCFFLETGVIVVIVLSGVHLRVRTYELFDIVMLFLYVYKKNWSFCKNNTEFCPRSVSLKSMQFKVSFSLAVSIAHLLEFRISK